VNIYFPSISKGIKGDAMRRGRQVESIILTTEESNRLLECSSRRDGGFKYFVCRRFAKRQACADQ
jgi:hypothetical protein